MSARLDVRQVAAGRWPSILKALGIDDHALSGKHVPCPLCGGRDRFRFDDKEGRGTYFCSGCGAGDGVQLALSFTGMPFKELAQKIEQIAGVASPEPACRTARSENDKRAALNRVFRESSIIQRGDEVERYLVGRGMDLPELPLSIRSHPGLSYRDEFGKSAGTFPAMLGIVTSASGQPLSIHRTYIHEGKKAPVSTPKKLMQGFPIAGAAIRLFPVNSVVGIAEGIETALAAALLFSIPVWSCVSAAGIESFTPPEGIKRVRIFSDNDASFTGQKASYAAAHRMRLKGYDVDVVVPPDEGDWLDHLASQNVRAI